MPRSKGGKEYIFCCLQFMCPVWTTLKNVKIFSFFMTYCKYQAPFPCLGLENQMWRQPESLSRVRESWLCVYLQYTLWCMWNPPYTRAHTHTPLKACLYIYVDIYNLVLWLKLLLLIIIIKKVLGLCQNAAKHHLQLNFQRLIMYNTEGFQKDKTV